MARKWFYYMLGRLICGDDCLSQVFHKCRATGKLRYQIQAKDYNEGILWGKICAKEVFKTDNYRSYQKSDGAYNTVINLQNEDVLSLFKNGYISPRKHSDKFKSSTALAVIKNIPIEKLLKFGDEEIAEFLAGCFDSDGTIRPKRSGMVIFLDTQVDNREMPLAYDQIRLFKRWAESRKMPRILRVRIIHPPETKFKNRAKIFYGYTKKLLPNVKLEERRNVKGVTIWLTFSCNVRMRSENRNVWKFWIKNVVPRLLRDDKKTKFLNFYEKRKHLFSPIEIKNIGGFGKELAKYINEQSYVTIRRPTYPQCEIKIRFQFLADANGLKDKIEEHIACKTRIRERYGKFFVIFNISSKNFLEIEKFVMPFIEKDMDKITDFLNTLKNRISGDWDVQLC